jgi:hypothetical protein
MPRKLKPIEETVRETPTQQELQLLNAQVREFLASRLAGFMLEGTRLRLRRSDKGCVGFTVHAIVPVTDGTVVKQRDIANLVGYTTVLGDIDEISLEQAFALRNKIFREFLDQYERTFANGRACWRRKDTPPAPTFVPTPEQQTLPLQDEKTDKLDKVLDLLGMIKHLDRDVQSQILREALR